MKALSICIAETQSLSCFNFCVLSLNFHWSKSGMSCSPAVIYSVCKPYVSETSKSEPGYVLLAIISSEHTQLRI